MYVFFHMTMRGRQLAVAKFVDDPMCGWRPAESLAWLCIVRSIGCEVAAAIRCQRVLAAV